MSMTPINPQDRRFVLASGSPRRLELMRHIGFDPIVVRGWVEEVVGEGEAPDAYTRRLAKEKAQDVASAIELYETQGAPLEDRMNRPLTASGSYAFPHWILSADTIVVLDEEILEKPADAEHAASMLRSLSGTRHAVLTSFCWLDRHRGTQAVETVETWVEFRELDEATIARYVATGEPMDKAGAYGIQDIGATMVSRIEGSYSCVVGLPLSEVVQTLQRLDGLRDYPFADV